MTLFKQIASIFSIFIILIIGSVMYLNFNSSNQFIQNQLYTTAEDTATSLGLSLSMNIPEDSEDLSTMQTMINAIFDRGYYESIVLKDMNGKVLIENKNDFKVKDIPDWFLHNVKLQVPTAKTQISSGWMPYGILSIKLHTGHAYVQLWNIFRELLTTFAILVSLVLGILYIVLSIVLKPLKGVEKQAMAITKNDFIIQESIPFTTEFKNVVKGMNTMVAKVKNIFDHEALMVKKYNNLLYNDQYTGMGNRKFFSLRLSSLLDQQDASSSGTVIIFVLNDFIEAKKEIGYKILSEYINALAEIFYKTTDSIEERVVTRLKDSEFSLILPNTSYEQSKVIANTILQQSHNILPNELRKLTQFYICGGATYFNEKDKQKDILARADFALSSAKMKNEPNVHFHEIKEDETLEELGQEEWYKLVTTAIKEDGIKLALQPVKDDLGKIYHQEVYLRVSDTKGTIYPARLFMPILNSLNMTNEVDKKVIKIAMKLSQRGTHIAINIATSFVQHINNITWLENIFKHSVALNLHLSFEASNYAIVHNLDNYINFAHLVQKYDYDFGIDNFSITKADLKYLQDLKPAYIKANKSFYIDMHDQGQNSSYESFNILAKSLDIKVIATAVENKQESDSLKEIAIHLMQGKFIEEPSL